MLENDSPTIPPSLPQSTGAVETTAAVTRTVAVELAPVAPPPSPISSAFSWIRDLAFSVLLAVVLIVFIYQPVKVEGTSMMPALTDQERIFINKFTYRFGLGSIERGDTVVFWYPQDPSKSYIKRVIGLPGDRVRIQDGDVYVNGAQLQE